MDQYNNSLKQLISDTNSDVYIFVASVNDENADKFIRLLRNNYIKKDNCSLILTTYGGDPDAGYRIVRTIKRYYSKFSLYIFGSCKSTGTLMALGADEIVMSDFGEFGPLDIQLTRDDELSNTSGLNFAQSLMSLNEQLFRAFEENFLGLKRRSRNTITTRTAAEICSKLAVGLISPISAQIDPVKLGEVQRSIKIANEYGTRLSVKTTLIAKLIVGYPSHGFV
ncbi:MAG: SppA protein, partial [Bacteroidetes bacterium]